MTPGYGFAYFRWRSGYYLLNDETSYSDPARAEFWRKLDFRYFELFQVQAKASWRDIERAYFAYLQANP